MAFKYQSMDVRQFAEKPPEPPPPPLETEREELSAAHARLQTMMQGVAALQAEHAQHLAQVADAVTQLALLLAERVVDHELATNKAMMLQCAQSILAETAGERTRALFFNTTDLQEMQTHHANDWRAMEALPGVTIAADPALPRGGCRVDAAAYRIDGSIMRRMEFLWNELLGRVEVSAPSATNTEPGTTV